MAYKSLGIKQWGSYTNPKITFETLYDLKRSGQNMQYKIKIILQDMGSTYFFGYPIYLNLLLDNVKKVSAKTIKKASPNTWDTGDIYYESDWITVSNKLTGTTSLKVNLYSGSGCDWDATMSFNLPIVPAVSTLNVINDFNIGETIQISFTKYDSTYIDSLSVKLDGNVIKTIQNVTSPITLEFTDEELETIYNLMSKVKEMNFTFTVSTTNSSGTSLGTNSKEAKGTIIDALPTFSEDNISYYDSNEDIVAITKNNQQLVQELSNLMVNITEAKGKKGATITEYAATINGITKTIETAGSIDFGTFNISSDLILSVTAIDSRGNKTTVNKTVVFLGWVLPSANISITRLNNFEDTTFLRVKATYSSVDNKNIISIKYQNKKSTEDAYSELVSIEDDVETTINCDKNNIWEFKIIVADSFGSTTYNGVLAKGKFIVFYDTKLYSVGINGFPTHENALEVFGDIYISNDEHTTKISPDKITVDGVPINGIELLWTGEAMSDGESVTFEESIWNFKFLLFRPNAGVTYLMAPILKGDGTVRGSNTYAAESHLEFFAFRGVLSEDGKTLTQNKLLVMRVATSGTSISENYTGITEIYGVR